MIPHRKNAIITKLFGYYSFWLLWNRFRKISLTPESRVPQFEPNVPIIAISNHASWWDPLLLIYLSVFYLKQECYGVFAEEELKRYGVFRYLGAYSVDRSRPEARAFLEYSRKLLEGTGRLLWIYPQGDLVSAEETDLHFKKGFAQILSGLSKVQILMMISSYDFWIEPEPEILVEFLPVEILEPPACRQAGIARAGFVKGVVESAQRKMSERLQNLRKIVRSRDVAGLKPFYARRPRHGNN